MNIKQLAKEMRAHARQHPLNVLNTFDVDEGCERVETVGGVRIKFILTLNLIGGLNFWSLSFSRIDKKHMKDCDAKKVVDYFLDGVGPLIPSHNPTVPFMRQYGQQAG